MQRSCADVNFPYKWKCWTNSGGPLVNSLVWEVNSHPCAGTGSPAAGLTQPGPSGPPLSGMSYVSPHQSSTFRAIIYSQRCGSAWVLMPNRIRISMLMPIRIRIGIKTIPILRRILPPSVTHVRKSELFYFYSQHCFIIQCFIFIISVKCVICFHYFGQHIEIFWKKVFFMYLRRSLWLFRNPPWFHKSCVFLYYIPLQ
jgi:hypothetical protein